MDLSVQWAGEKTHPEYLGVVRETVVGELVKRGGSVRGAAALKDNWNNSGRPASNNGWPAVLQDAVIAVQRHVPLVVFSHYPGIKIDFVGR